MIYFFGIAVAAILAYSSVVSGASILGEAAVSDWNRYDDLFKRYAGLYGAGMPWEWAKAISLNESDLGRNPRVQQGLVSSDGKSWGLMQLTLPTANDFLPGVTVAQLKDPETSVRIACQYLGYLYARYAGDDRKTIMSYNQGQGHTDAGKTYAAGYYEKWKNNLQLVEEQK